MLDQAPVVLEKLKDRESTYIELQVRLAVTGLAISLQNCSKSAAILMKDFSSIFIPPQERMASPEVASNPTEFQKVAQAAADLEQTVSAYRQYGQLQQELKEAKEMTAESAGI